MFMCKITLTLAFFSSSEMVVSVSYSGKLFLDEDS